jgi:hypothetical protein
MSENTAGGAARTNTLSIASLIVAFFFPIIGAILGHVALGQIKKTGESGRGLALAGIIIGWSVTALALIAFFVWMVAFAFVGVNSMY